MSSDSSRRRASAEPFPKSSPESFRRKVRLGFAGAALLVFVFAAAALIALNGAVSSARFVLDQSRQIIEFGRFQSAVERKMTTFRGYLLTGDERRLRAFGVSRAAVRIELDRLERQASGEDRASVARLREGEAEHERVAEIAIGLRRSARGLDSIARYFGETVEPRREAFEAAIDSYLRTRDRTLEAAARDSERTNVLSFAVLAAIGFCALAATVVLSVVLTRRLSALFEAEQEERHRAQDSAGALAASEERFRRLYDSGMIGIGFGDLSGTLVDGNDAFLRILGRNREELGGGGLRWDHLTPREWKAADENDIEELRKTGVFQPHEKEYLRADGGRVSVLVGGALLPGAADRFATFALDVTERKRGEAERADLLRREQTARAAAEGAQRRSSFLARASQVLASSLDYAITLRSIAALAVPDISDWCFIDLISDEGIRRVAVTCASPERAVLARQLETENLLDADAPVGPPNVLRTGRSELIESLDDEVLSSVARSPDAYRILKDMGILSVMTVAIRDSQAVVGIITLVSAESGRRFGSDDLALAEDLAVRAGVAMENARLFDLVRQERAIAEWHEARSSFLARASEVLASSLDYRTTLASVARLAITEVADFCVIDMRQPDGALRTLAIEHSDASIRDEARNILKKFPSRPDQPYGPPNVIRTGNPELASTISEEMLRAATLSESHYQAAAKLGFRSYMCVPIGVRGQLVGTISFIASSSGRNYTPDDLSLAEALAYRASLAIDNSRLYEDAQEAIRARDEFLSVASHELKTPITTLQLQIQGLIRRVRSGATPSAEALAERLGTSERQVERLTHLINDLLDISRITGGRLDLYIEPVDFAAVLREVSARLEESLLRAGCTLALNAPEPQVGAWDRLRLDQILTNLISNAMKYGAGKPIEISLTGTSESIRLAVTDEGIGIAPENQARIFERFERAVSGRHYGGLGLGLWIVRQIVDALGGTIAVESESGRGSVFILELPRERTRVTGAPGRLSGEVRRPEAASP
ncbi:MAG: ATP-binding protein [Acidobacteriota bacterium]|nr:ATP-binding protein [Acidobacteriota bacterium]